MNNELVLPSQALNRKFVIDDQDVVDAEQDFTDKQTSAITAHAMQVHNLGLLLPRDEVSEVVEGLSYCRLPNAPAHLAGMGSVRGVMVPIFDLSLILGLGSDSTDQKTVLVIGQASKAIGFLIDALPARQTLLAEHRLQSLPPLPEKLRPHTRACFLKDEKIWVDWDIYEFILQHAGAA